ncbi:SOS response-associated peptidase family protein [Moorena producens]|uniref:SOS response-associated peptidase family protein n=1 Tax=Moorena producens TaxID=1155739 RepID=UPI003C74ECF2
MCGRFTLTTIGVSLARAFNLDDVPTQEARYNIAPTQLVATVLNPSNDSERQWQLLPKILGLKPRPSRTAFL